MEIGALAACTKRVMEATKGLGQRGLKGSMKDCFIFGSWFESKSLSDDVIDVGSEMFGMVKTNTNGFCKYTIEKLTNYWPVGYYLVLKINSVVPRYRQIIAAG